MEAIFVAFGILIASFGAAEIDRKTDPQANIAYLQEQMDESKADLAAIEHGKGAVITPEAKPVAQAEVQAIDPELDGDAVAVNSSDSE